MKAGTLSRILMVLSFFWIQTAHAQNPLIRDQYTADPSARVFGEKVYVYPSHDIRARPGQGRKDWFCMEDYHVFSSDNLTDWKDHGVILSQKQIAWADTATYSMWAPDCIHRSGKYYLYFPVTAKSGVNGPGFTIGVAVADQPYGPFTPPTDPIKGVHGIDPNVFIDKDGQAYLYWADKNIYAAKLKDNMMELASEVKTLGEMPEKGLIEGPFLFERNGIYYLTYPHAANRTERLEYATSNNPLGPFKYQGVIMDESTSGCWTNHQSVVQFKGQWYLFYHDDQLAPKLDKTRSIRADSLFFAGDGSIKKVIPTLRGVGQTMATNPIQIDRYSDKGTGASVDFINTEDKFAGWKTQFNGADAWVRYNSVNFGQKKLKMVQVRAQSKTGGYIEIRLDSVHGPLISLVKIPPSDAWLEVQKTLINFKPGVHHLFVSGAGQSAIEIDWLKFN